VKNRVLEVCTEIISDHAEGVHPLDRAFFERLKRILIERLRWSRSANAWSDVILWADLMLRLFTASASAEFATPENAVIAKLQKVGRQ
jgi:hypothetical protein